MKKFVLFIVLGVMVISFTACTKAPTNPVIRLSTTTSVNDSGLMSYLQPVFEKDTGYTLEITSAGTQDIAWSRDGQQVTLDLGTVHLTRMIVVSHDQGLRDRLQQGYDQKFAENVRRLTAAP